jgi:serine/threonine protein kinase
MSAADVEVLGRGIAAERRSADSDELARELVRGGKLTRFQAAAIYQGKADGLLLGNYLVLDKLAAGGMGQVFRARHRRMDRVVALKVLSKKVINAPGAIERFRREAKAAAILTHPNIVTAFDADEAGGMHFLVMEYVDGCDLSSLVKRNGPLAVPLAVDCVRQAARGLAYAHGKGIIHRDIKPANLLLDRLGTLKILDLGLARITGEVADSSGVPEPDLTHTGNIMGTIDYMSPEQAMDSRQADARSDIYSLGCTLHYLLAGRPPYREDTVMKRLAAHQQAGIPNLSTSRSDVPAALQAIFERMLAKDPAARIQSMSEVDAALDLDVLAVSLPAARPLPPSAPASSVASSGVKEYESVLLPGQSILGSKPARPRAIAAVVAGLAILLVATGYAFWGRDVREPDAPAPTDVGQAVTGPLADPFGHAQNLPVADASAMPAPTAPPVVPVQPSSLAGVDSPSAAAPMPGSSAITAPSAAAPVSERTPPGAAVENPLPTAAAAVPPIVPPVAAAGAPVAMPSAPTLSQPAVSTTISPSQTIKAEPSPPTPEPPLPARQPIPPVLAQADAERLLRELFKDHYALAKDADGKAVLAQKLWDQAQKNQDDPTARYVMLQRSRDLAVEIANAGLVGQTVDALASSYDFDRWSEMAASFEGMVGKPHLPAANKGVAEAAVARVHEAQKANEFALSVRFADAALISARKARDPALLKQVIETNKRTLAARQQWDEYQAALAKLKSSADDEGANQTVGRYMCFVANDWPQGLPLLAKGNDGTLKELALASVPTPETPESLVELGDAWWNAAEKSKGKDKADLQIGAMRWYGLAEPNLSGLAKTVVTKRLTELQDKAAAAAGAPPKVPPANGMWLAQTFDCKEKSYLVTLGPDFDIQKSWTLALEFMAVDLSPGNHVLFFWGDGRAGRDPLFVGLNGPLMQATVNDAAANTAFRLETTLDPIVIGQWIRLVFHYDAPTKFVSLTLNNRPIKHERSTVVPTVDQPMSVWIGGERDRGQRFSGQIRNVWLGNSSETNRRS